MKMTPWFPGDVKPVRVGVYQRHYSFENDRFCHWNGLFWSNNGRTVDIADQFSEVESRVQDLPWRGLAEEPKS